MFESNISKKIVKINNNKAINGDEDIEIEYINDNSFFKQNNNNINQKSNQEKDQKQFFANEDINKQKQTNQQSNNQQQQINDNIRFDNMDYNQNQCSLIRAVFLNLIMFSVKFKSVLNRGQKIMLQHMPQLLKTDQIKYLDGQFNQKLKQYQTKTQKLSVKDTFMIIVKTFKFDIVLSIILILLDAAFKLFNSIALNYLLKAIIDQNKNDAYMWAGIQISSIFVSSTIRHNSWEVCQKFTARYRLTLVNVMYNKITQLSTFSIKQANIGKIINLISGDLTQAEFKTFFLLIFVGSPFILIASCIILYYRLNSFWGIFSILLLIIIYPLQVYLGKRAGQFVKAKTLISDEKIKLCNEAIEGIRLIKMYAWELAFTKMIKELRLKEIKQIFNMSRQNFYDNGLSQGTALISTLVTFILIYYTTDNEINTAQIFSTFEMLSYIKTSVILFGGMGISFIYELITLLQRFNDVYNIPEIQMKNINENQEKNLQPLEENIVAKFDNFIAYWSVSDFNKSVLKIENLIIEQNKLYTIIGKVGSGKSSFLQCFLNEIPRYSGIFQTKTSIAYVEQEPYIFSGTIRENIIFGKPFDDQFYWQVVKNCCLEQDLNEMSNSDLTEIGERGINLSGGQKARLCLARAVYSNADIYLLDDPLSAVDAKVARQLFYQVLKGMLSQKTILLVTHQIHYTSESDQVLIIEDGVLCKQGTFLELKEDIMKKAGQFHFIDIDQKNQNLQENNQVILSPNKNNNLGNQSNLQSPKKTNVIQLITKEEKEKSDVSFQTYKRYLQIANLKYLFIFIFILFALDEVSYSLFNRELGKFDDPNPYPNHSNDKNLLFGLAILFCGCYIMFCIIKYILMSYFVLQTNQSIHNQMFQSLMRSPVVYFDQTPTGRIINRFSGDISTIDMQLTVIINNSLEGLLIFFNLIIMVCSVNPYIIIPVVIEIILLAIFFQWYKDILIQIKSQDMINKSPVFSFFSATLQGLQQIKIYNQTQNFQEKIQGLINTNIRCNILYWLCGRAFGAYIQYISWLMSVAGTFIIISTSDKYDYGLAGQSIMYLNILIEYIQWPLRQWLNLDTLMTCCERSYSLIDLPSEAPIELSTDQQYIQKNNQKIEKFDNKQQKLEPNNKYEWPNQGNIVLQNVNLKYRSDTDLVLKNLCFSIQAGQKVGCIGRTGAGKSSIIQALFRLTEIESSENTKLLIDDIDIRNLGLHQIRKNISLIPQTPFVFTGTIKRNIDPFDEHADEEIWQVLEESNLKETVKKLEKGLYTDMTNVQNVFSVGQKQLICLARAILKKNKILILDEATANVDMETDQFIQKKIKQRFADCTILTIAHRINTIADYDKVIVMDNGQVIEQDQPYKLLVNDIGDEDITSNGYFAQMVKHTGESNSISIFNIAKEQFFAANKLK